MAVTHIRRSDCAPAPSETYLNNADACVLSRIVALHGLSFVLAELGAQCASGGINRALFTLSTRAARAA